MQHIIQSGETLSRIAAAHGTTLQRLLEANPQYRAAPDRIRVGELVQIPNGAASGTADAAPPASTPPAPWLLGSLSSKYETGGRGPGTVSTGIGDAGGVSYGSYQMTSRPRGGTVARFIAEPDFPWRARFAGLTPGAADFSARWKALAAEADEAFFAAQHAYIQRTHFDPLVRRSRRRTGCWSPPARTPSRTWSGRPPCSTGRTRRSCIARLWRWAAARRSSPPVATAIAS